MIAERERQIGQPSEEQKRKELAVKVLRELKEEDAVKSKQAIVYGGRRSLADFPESERSLEDDLLKSIGMIEQTADFARKEIKEHPAEYAQLVEMWLNLSVQETTTGTIVLTGEFYARDKDGKGKLIPAAGFSIEKVSRGDDPETMKKRKEINLLLTGTLANGMLKIGNQKGIRTWLVTDQD